MEKPANANKINKFESVVKGLGQERDLLMQNLHKFKGREAKVRTYPKLLDQHDSLGGDFEKKYDLIMPGRREAIKVVAQKLKRENSNPAQSFAVLGRTPDTFGRTGDPARDSKSWINQNPNEAGRVLSTPDWSLAVNDAFIDAGLGEKSQFALVTPYKQEVLAKLKELLNNPTGLTREQIKMKIKKFVKEKNEPALYSGNTEHNEGYNISMNELEQIIDDNYVVMQHDTKAGEKDPGRLTPTAVMVPSGKGQTIKEELEKAVSLRRSRSAASLGSILEQDPALKKKGP